MLKKIPNKTITSILNRYQPSAEAKVYLTGDLSPSQALENLSKAELYHDLVQFIAHGLPMIDAIYWATEVLSTRVNVWDETQLKTINSAKIWLKKPNETYRIRANQLADRLGLESAPAWAAKAVYWSGTGSIVSPDLPSVMPPAFLYSQAVTAAITVAAAVPAWSDNDNDARNFYLTAIELGLEIAQGNTMKIELLTFEEQT